MDGLHDQQVSIPCSDKNFGFGCRKKMLTIRCLIHFPLQEGERETVKLSLPLMGCSHI